MQQQGILEESGVCPSFSCYSSDSLTSAVVAKVIREEQEARFHEFGEVVGDDFEFSLVLSDDEASNEVNDSRSWAVFPVFNQDLLVKDFKSKDNEVDVPASITGTLAKLFLEERQESLPSSCSSSESDESESPRSKSHCVYGCSSPSMAKCKKSSSTGSGSKRWSIRFLLRRSNSEGKQPAVVLIPKKVDSPKRRQNSGEVVKLAGKLKARTPVHEQFYVQKRAENEVVRRKSYLPYKQDLVGLFSSVNGKMLPF